MPLLGTNNTHWLGYKLTEHIDKEKDISTFIQLKHKNNKHGILKAGVF